MKFAETEMLVTEWAKDRLLFEQSSPRKQVGKLFEEITELFEGIINNDEEEIIDAIGDIVVVLTIIARMHTVTVEYCYQVAYNEIKDRKGSTVNGIFIKE